MTEPTPADLAQARELVEAQRAAYTAVFPDEWFLGLTDAIAQALAAARAAGAALQDEVIKALQASVLALEADKDVLMEQGESIARERDSLRLQCAATEAQRLKDNASLIQERDALQAELAEERRRFNNVKWAINWFRTEMDCALAREERPG
jgi:hypothetical protein